MAHGSEAKARITEIARDQVKFQILAKANSPRATHPVWLVQALTKAKSMDMIIEKATELGVSESAPLQSDHSVAHVDEEKAEAKVEKWQKLTIEAAKQCGQNWLPVVHPPQAPKDFVTALPKACGQADRVAPERSEAAQGRPARTSREPQAGHADRAS